MSTAVLIVPTATLNEPAEYALARSRRNGDQQWFGYCWIEGRIDCHRKKQWKKFQFSPEYSRWRFQVFQRDNYRCIECGSKKKIQAHHIFKKALYAHLAIIPENGATLCAVCHDAIKHREEECAERYAVKISSMMRPLALYDLWPMRPLVEERAREVAA